MIRHDRHSRVPLMLVSAMMLAVGAFTSAPGMSAAAQTADGDTQRIVLQPDPTPDLANPERGLNTVVSSLQTISPRAVDDAVKQHFTLIRTYVDLSEYTGTSVLPDELLRQIGNGFALLRSNGVKAILRFSYSPGGVPQCQSPGNPEAEAEAPSDAPLDVILGHIDQVSSLVADNADVISSIEAGFLGEFGEWHCSTYNRTEPGDLRSPLRDDAMRAVVERELQAFPAALQIAVRYPRDIDFLQTVPSIAASDRLGNHQDCYAANTWDSDTWDQPSTVMNAQKVAVGVIGEDHIVAGVACDGGPGTRVTCGTAPPGPGLEPGNPAEMAAMHFSYLAGDFRADAIDIYKNEGCWDAIVASLGYRLQLTEVDLPTVVAPGTSAPITVELTNDGWASPINSRPVFLTLTDADGVVTAIPLDVDPRAWKSNTSVTIDAAVVVPAALAPGVYTPGLWLPDRSASIAADGRYAIRFANLGTWDPATGINTLPADVRVEAAGPTPGPGAPGSSAPILADSGVDAGAVVGLVIAGCAAVVTGGFLTTRRRSIRPPGRHRETPSAQ